LLLSAFLCCILLLLPPYTNPRDLHSFPTRRSSDLAQHPATVKDRPRQRFVTQRQQVVGAQVQHCQRHGQHHQELAEGLEQFHQRLDREHALEPRQGIEPLALGGQQLGAEQPAAEHDWPYQGGNQQQQEQRADDAQPLADRRQQVQSHGVGAVERFALDGKVVHHQVHQLAGHRRPEHQQADRGDHYHRQGVEFLGAGHLAFLAGFLLAFRRGVFRAFLTAVLRHQRAPTISRNQISASEANRWYCSAVPLSSTQRMNRPNTRVRGKPMEKMLSCGAARIITPKDRLTISSAVIAGRPIRIAAAITQENRSTRVWKSPACKVWPMGKVVKLSTNTSITTRCPFIARNSSVTSMVNTWATTATEMPMAGSFIEAKPRPICMATICPAMTWIWNSSCNRKPM